MGAGLLPAGCSVSLGVKSDSDNEQCARRHLSLNRSNNLAPPASSGIGKQRRQAAKTWRAVVCFKIENGKTRIITKYSNTRYDRRTSTDWLYLAVFYSHLILQVLVCVVGYRLHVLVYQIGEPRWRQAIYSSSPPLGLVPVYRQTHSSLGCNHPPVHSNVSLPNGLNRAFFGGRTLRLGGLPVELSQVFENFWSSTDLSR